MSYYNGAQGPGFPGQAAPQMAPTAPPAYPVNYPAAPPPYVLPANTAQPALGAVTVNMQQNAQAPPEANVIIYKNIKKSSCGCGWFLLILILISVSLKLAQVY